MTKWICNACHTSPCYVENESCCIGTPTGCPYRLAPNSYWKPEWKRDCTEEKKDELPEGIDGRMTTHYNAKRITDLDKKVQELIASGQGQMTRIQELEQMLQNHIHYIAGTTGKPARREK